MSLCQKLVIAGEKSAKDGRYLGSGEPPGPHGDTAAHRDEVEAGEPAVPGVPAQPEPVG